MRRMPTASNSLVRISLCDHGLVASRTISSRSALLHTAMTCSEHEARGKGGTEITAGGCMTSSTISSRSALLHAAMTCSGGGKAELKALSGIKHHHQQVSALTYSNDLQRWGEGRIEGTVDSYLLSNIISSRSALLHTATTRSGHKAWRRCGREITAADCMASSTINRGSAISQTIIDLEVK